MDDPIMNEPKKELTPEQLKQIEEVNFFSDQVKVNALLYQGIKIILDKLTKLEEKLDKK